MIRLGSKRRGAILIFTLWVLSFLAVLAVSVAAGIRQKMILVKRLDERSRMAAVTQAGIKKSCALIRQLMSNAGFQYTPYVKAGLHNDPHFFSETRLGEDSVQVSFTAVEQGEGVLRFGVTDEESRININTASPGILAALIERVLGMKQDEAQGLARALLDWRQYGESSPKGFFSDDYYANLQYPYRKKDADYESLDEMLLVKGMDKERFERLSPYLTVYGSGKININTAGRQVLSALGLDDALIDALLTVRRGEDGAEATKDDHVFARTFDVASEVNAQVKLLPEQMRTIDGLNAQGLLDVTSSYFRIEAAGWLARQGTPKKVLAVYAPREQRVLYWKEK